MNFVQFQFSPLLQKQNDFLQVTLCATRVHLASLRQMVTSGLIVGTLEDNVIRNGSYVGPRALISFENSKQFSSAPLVDLVLSVLFLWQVSFLVSRIQRRIVACGAA